MREETRTDQKSEALDLSIILTQPPGGSPPEVLASIPIACDMLALHHTGELLLHPLTWREREGIEATMFQGVRAFGIRRSRYMGFAKTHLQQLGITATINLVRAVAWFDGDELAPTRVSAFQRLYQAA